MFARKFEKRKYQVDVAKAAFRHRAKRVLIVSPGGSGKTVIAALIVKLLLESTRGKRVLLVSHRREIIEQLESALRGKIAIGFIMAGYDPDPKAPIQVASIDTLRKRALPPADLVLVDEAHRSVAKGYAEVLLEYEKREVKIIGLSATPYRLDGRGLKERFDVMFEAAKPSQLLGKYIMEPRVFSAAPEHLPNLIGVRSMAGDFHIGDLVRRVNKHGLISGIVKEVRKRVGKRRTVVFCVSIEHSLAVAENLRKAGYKALHIDGSFSADDRVEVLEKLRRGQLQIVTCCMILSEGWDLPTCDAVVLARPTRSLSLYIQMANRGARMSKVRPLVIDCAMNYVMHGYPHTDREWDLNGEARGSLATPSAVKACKACGCINEASASECVECGEQFTRVLTPKEREELELAEWNERERQSRVQHIRNFAKKKGFDEKWVRKVEELWAAAAP